MSKVTYPKGSVNPNRGVGEQMDTSWPESSDTSYPDDGPTASTYHGDRYKTLECKGNSSGKNGSDYSKKKRSFGTEGFR